MCPQKNEASAATDLTANSPPVGETLPITAPPPNSTGNERNLAPKGIVVCIKNTVRIAMASEEMGRDL